MENEKKIFDFWNKINEAMCIISDAAVIAANSEEVIEHLKDSGCYEETYEPIFWITDYLTKMFED